MEMEIYLNEWKQSLLIRKEEIEGEISGYEIERSEALWRRKVSNAVMDSEIRKKLREECDKTIIDADSKIATAEYKYKSELKEIYAILSAIEKTPVD